MQPLVWCPDPLQRRRLRSLFPRQTIFANWFLLRPHLDDAGTVLLIVESVKEWNIAMDLRRLRDAMPSICVLLVTSPDPENARNLLNIDADRLFWLHEIEDVLTTIDHWTTPTFRQRLLRGLKNSDQVTKAQRDILLPLFAADVPPRSCQEWAKMVHCSVSTIKYQLRPRLTGTGFTPKSLLDAALLLMVFETCSLAPDWNRLARRIGVDQRRLRAAERRLLTPESLSSRMSPGETLLARLINVLTMSSGGQRTI